jgi:regulator of protease activity HflC (stomatin/prohibitin superfamily)
MEFMGILVGAVGWFVIRYVLGGFYTVNQNERAVKTIFGRAERLVSLDHLENPSTLALRDNERDRYQFPSVRVIPPGGPYFKWPWEKVYKVSVATETFNMAFDPEQRAANQGGTIARCSHEGSAQHGPHGTDPLPRVRGEPLR